MGMKAKSILVISDLHTPYEHPDAVRFLAACKAKFKPDTVICIGDEADFHALSYHESNPDLAAAGDELEQAIQHLKPIYKLFPKCTVIESNHGSMVLRKAITGGIPKKAIRRYNEILEAPKGWKWVDDTIIQTETGPVYFCHGKTTTPGKLASQYGMSTVQGHYHEKAQINYISTPERLMFDAHTGCLANDKSLALQYNKINPKRPIVSLLVVINGIPQIVPMHLNKKHRWTGRL
jgi:Calcineurin-like phosphoesterase